MRRLSIPIRLTVFTLLSLLALGAACSEDLEPYDTRGGSEPTVPEGNG